MLKWLKNSVTSFFFSSEQVIKSSCAVDHLLIIHLIPLGVSYEVLNLNSEDHFCSLEILPGIILAIPGCFSISKRSFLNSFRIWCSVLTFLKVTFIGDLIVNDLLYNRYCCYFQEDVRLYIFWEKEFCLGRLLIHKKGTCTILVQKNFRASL